MGKTHDTDVVTDRSEADELRVAVRELNQSIAYLSRMVLQLQRSMGNKTENTLSLQEKPETIH